ncbi:MAG: hypothetical protein ACI81Q_001583, partial [Paracoccaceae bacterium]
MFHFGTLLSSTEYQGCALRQNDVGFDTPSPAVHAKTMAQSGGMTMAL